jgi:hypothetical protein
MHHLAACILIPVPNQYCTCMITKNTLTEDKLLCFILYQRLLLPLTCIRTVFMVDGEFRLQNGVPGYNCQACQTAKNIPVGIAV